VHNLIIDPDFFDYNMNFEDKKEIVVVEFSSISENAQDLINLRILKRTRTFLQLLKCTVITNKMIIT
jgi:hypothetical protein